MPEPIYNQPNHKYYGPARRIHLILMYLYGDALSKIETLFEEFHGISWTEGMQNLLQHGEEEGHVAKIILRDMLT